MWHFILNESSDKFKSTTLCSCQIVVVFSYLQNCKKNLTPIDEVISQLVMSYKDFEEWVKIFSEFSTKTHSCFTTQKPSFLKILIRTRLTGFCKYAVQIFNYNAFSIHVTSLVNRRN